jgi:hypothetical protein
MVQIVDTKPPSWLPNRMCFRTAGRATRRSVKVRCIQDLIQPRVEWMRAASRQILRRHPHRGLPRRLSAFTHRHRRQCSTRDRSCRSRECPQSLSQSLSFFGFFGLMLFLPWSSSSRFCTVPDPARADEDVELPSGETSWASGFDWSVRQPFLI